MSDQRAERLLALCERLLALFEERTHQLHLIAKERQEALDALEGLLWVALRNGSSENDPYVIRARAVLRKLEDAE